MPVLPPRRDRQEWLFSPRRDRQECLSYAVACRCLCAYLWWFGLGYEHFFTAIELTELTAFIDPANPADLVESAEPADAGSMAILAQRPQACGSLGVPGGEGLGHPYGRGVYPASADGQGRVGSRQGPGETQLPGPARGVQSRDVPRATDRGAIHAARIEAPRVITSAISAKALG